MEVSGPYHTSMLSLVMDPQSGQCEERERRTEGRIGKGPPRGRD